MAKTPAPGASRFAHLAPGAKAAADDKPEDKKDDKAKDGKANKADDSDDTEEELDELEERVEDLEEKEDEEDEKATKVASAPRLRKLAAAARGAERARCAAIFAAPAASANPALAAQLAFGSSLPPSEAIGIMAAAHVPAPKADGSARRGLDQRMQAAPDLKVGGDGAAPPDTNTPEGAAAFIIASHTAARGGK